MKLPESEIKDTIEYEYDDIDSGQKITVTLHRNSVSETEEVQENSISFPVIFHRYDAGRFIINGKIVPLMEGTSPIDSQFYADVKAESDHADSDGEITEMIWDGETYLLNGEVCRNASATLTEAEKIYAVNYSDIVDLPDTDGFQAILTYGTDINEPTGVITYEIEASAEYDPVQEQQKIQPLFIGIGIAILAVAIAIVLVLVIIVKRRKKQAEEI